MFEVKDAMSWDHMWSVWFAGKPDKPFSEEAKKRMAWGSDHEDEAAMVLARAVDGIFFETPLIKHKCKLSYIDVALVVILLTTAQVTHGSLRRPTVS